MKNILSILLIITINNCYTQEYNFINTIFKEYKSDTIYLEKKFLTFDSQTISIKFSKENIQYLWKPSPLSNTPPIDSFFNNFNLFHLKADLVANKNDSIIDFRKLDKRVFPSSLKYMREHTHLTYISISKPIYNCSKNWAIIFIDSSNLSHDIGSGNMYIYRKIDEKWILYHTIELWLS
jgi:hypothetical protein